jgi:hypothetical protein
MLVIAEIILTIFAWRNGWKWWALLPVGIAFFIGLIAGANMAAVGGDISDMGGLIVVDILAIIALIVMVSKKKIEKKVE